MRTNMHLHFEIIFFTSCIVQPAGKPSSRQIYLSKMWANCTSRHYPMCLTIWMRKYSSLQVTDCDGSQRMWGVCKFIERSYGYVNAHWNSWVNVCSIYRFQDSHLQVLWWILLMQKRRFVCYFIDSANTFWVWSVSFWRDHIFIRLIGDVQWEMWREEGFDSWKLESESHGVDLDKEEYTWI